MINETINTTMSVAEGQSTGGMYEVASIVAQGFITLMQDHHWVFTTLAIVGMVSVISAVGEKAFQAFKYLFMILVALPLILIIGLINKKQRKDRLKELGQIRAYLKDKPERWKIILFYVLSFGFLMFLTVNAIILYFKTMI